MGTETVRSESESLFWLVSVWIADHLIDSELWQNEPFRSFTRFFTFSVQPRTLTQSGLKHVDRQSGSESGVTRLLINTAPDLSVIGWLSALLGQAANSVCPLMEKEKKQKKKTDFLSWRQETQTQSYSTVHTHPSNSEMHSLAQIHLCTQWCRYTELVKPLHTVCYFWFRNGVRVQ